VCVCVCFLVSLFQSFLGSIFQSFNRSIVQSLLQHIGEHAPKKRDGKNHHHKGRWQLDSNDRPRNKRGILVRETCVDDTCSLCSVALVVLCCALLCSVVLCCALLCSVVLCCALLCSVVLCCALLCSVVLCCALLCFPAGAVLRTHFHVPCAMCHVAMRLAQQHCWFVPCNTPHPGATSLC
jgi:hypothetical protein